MLQERSRRLDHELAKLTSYVTVPSERKGRGRGGNSVQQQTPLCTVVIQL